MCCLHAIRNAAMFFKILSFQIEVDPTVCELIKGEFIANYSVVQDFPVWETRRCLIAQIGFLVHIFIFRDVNILADISDIIP
jgi:hypothetical protein